MELMKPKATDTLDGFIKNKEEYVFQIKFDGGSSIIKKHNGLIEIFHGDNPNRQNVKYPELMLDLKIIPDGDYIAELCVFNEKGVSEFRHFLKRQTENKVQINYFIKDKYPIVAIIHDIVKDGNTDVTGLSYIERLKILKEKITDTNHIKVIESFDKPDKILEQKDTLEGIVIKKRNSPYLFEKRDGWYKFRFNVEETVKCVSYENTETGIVLITEDGRRINLAGERSETARRKIENAGCVMCEISFHEKSDKGYRFTTVKRVL
jgi:ATP-dependent DNA ligase